MTADFSCQADNQANLYGGARTGVSTDQAVKFYLENGATASKINMGMSKVKKGSELFSHEMNCQVSHCTDVHLRTQMELANHTTG